MTLTARQHGYAPLPRDYVETFYRELAPRGHAVLFVGEVDGRPVAADLLTGCGGVLKGRLGGFDRSGDAGRLSVPGAVRWEAIRWAKREGYRWFDFGGIDPGMLHDLMAAPDRDDERWPSADRAKLAFGGQPFAYPQAVELVRPWPLRTAYDAARDSTAAGQRSRRRRSGCAAPAEVGGGVREGAARRSAARLPPVDQRGHAPDVLARSRCPSTRRRTSGRCRPRRAPGRRSSPVRRCRPASSRSRRSRRARPRTRCRG